MRCLDVIVLFLITFLTYLVHQDKGHSHKVIHVKYVFLWLSVSLILWTDYSTLVSSLHLKPDPTDRYLICENRGTSSLVPGSGWSVPFTKCPLFVSLYCHLFTSSPWEFIPWSLRSACFVWFLIYFGSISLRFPVSEIHLLYVLRFRDCTFIGL